MDAALQVNRRHLISGIQTIRRTTTPAERGEALLEFEDGRLCIYCGGVDVQAEAVGHWSGRAHVASSFLMRAERAIPTDDPLMLVVADGRLQLGSLRIRCSWDGTRAPVIHLPMNPNLRTLLTVSRQFSDSAIAGSGISELVTEAEERLRRALDSAARTLEPIGISRHDLESLINTKLRSSKRPDFLFGPEQGRLPLRFDGEQLVLGDEDAG